MQPQYRRPISRTGSMYVCAHPYSSVPRPCSVITHVHLHAFPSLILSPTQVVVAPATQSPSHTPRHCSKVRALSPSLILTSYHRGQPILEYFPNSPSPSFYPPPTLSPSSPAQRSQLPPILRLGLLSPSAHPPHSGNQSDLSQSPI